MKIATLSILATLFIGSLAQADTLAACRKRNPFVYHSFTWVYIESHNDQLLFRYGTGIDDRMLEIYFESEVAKTSDSTYEHHDVDHELTVKIKNEKLEFTLISEGKTVTKKNYECVSLK